MLVGDAVQHKLVDIEYDADDSKCGNRILLFYIFMSYNSM